MCKAFYSITVISCGMSGSADIACMHNFLCVDFSKTLEMGVMTSWVEPSCLYRFVPLYYIPYVCMYVTYVYYNLFIVGKLPTISIQIISVKV